MPFGEIVGTILRDFPHPLYGSVLVGMLCAFLGVVIVAKRIVFLGAVLTQVSVLGIAVTFLPFFAIPHTLGSMIFTIVAVVIFATILEGKRIPKDALLGASFVSAIALRILVVQKTPKVETAEIENLLRGDILFVGPDIFTGMAIVFAAVLLVFLLFFREISYVSFDSETAATQGYRTRFWELLFYVVAGVVISVATHMVGDTFVFGFLVIPPMAALLVMRNVRNIFLLSTLFGAVCPVIGLILAFRYDVPASPAMVAVAVAGLGVAWIVGKIRLCTG